MPALTETLVRRARPRSRRYELCCASLRGFMLRVLPSGAKVYYVRYREAGRDVRERLGPADALSHQEARRRAQARLADVRGDAVPTPVKAAPSAPEARANGARDPALQVRTFARRYFKDHVEARLKANSHRSYRSYLNHVLAEFADDRLDRIT
ncbi:MAG: DUF4102 domain-containing protein, partial [Myxococcales bacterium]|nr:DUF4102 domain-containing protein [Myxococcales bacterium]